MRYRAAIYFFPSRVSPSPISFDHFSKTHLDVFAFARISFLAQRWSPILVSRSRFSSRHYFLSITTSIPFSSFHLSQRASLSAHAATRRPISRYPLTCRRFFIRDTFRPSPDLLAHTLFSLSEGHWNRIKLYAGLSMPPFPPGAMKGDIRHDDRSGRRNGEIAFERGQNFLGLLSDVLIGLRQRQWLRKGFANLPVGGGYDGGSDR